MMSKWLKRPEWERTYVPTSWATKTLIYYRREWEKKKGVPKGQACWVKACDSVNSSRHRMERLYAPEGDAYIDQAWGPVNEYQCD